MFGALKYLDQEYPDAWYSEVLHSKAVISGITTIAVGDYAKFGATFILITGIIVSFTAAAGAFAIYTDQFNIPIMTLAIDPNSTGFYPIIKIIRGESLRIIANTNAGNFSVQHQYLRTTDIENPNRLPKP
jgi:hypothetical protein